jgi:hypothetical protein
MTKMESVNITEIAMNSANSTDRSADRSTDRSEDGSEDRSADGSADGSVDSSTNGSTDRSEDKSEDGAEDGAEDSIKVVVQDPPDFNCCICLNPVKESERNFYPCDCKMNIHHSCLATWLDSSDRVACERCGKNFSLNYVEVVSCECCYCCKIDDVKIWFNANKSNFLFAFMIFVVPFIGDNGPNLVKYTITEGEADCLAFSSQNDPFSFINILYPYPTALIIGLIGFIALYITLSWFVCNVKLFKKIPNTTLVLFALALNCIFHIIGLTILNCTFRSFSFSPYNEFSTNEGAQYGRCSEFNSLQVERYKWLVPFNINLVTYFLGMSITSISFFIVLSAVFVLYVIISVSIFLLSSLKKLVVNIYHNGCVKECCPCLIRRRIVINNANANANVIQLDLCT